VSFAYTMAAFLRVTHKMVAWEICLQDGGNVVFLSFNLKMAACEFCLQDGGGSESFTHKMAAWEICLQDGGNATFLSFTHKMAAFLRVFTARCYASAVLAMALCPSVRPSQDGVLLKRLNVGSHKQHHTIAQGL